MSNPLIATVDPGDAAGGLLTNMKTEGNAEFAGSGIFYDAASTLTDASRHNWVSLGIDIAGDGLDVLALVTDPFGVLLSAPIGWIIEHVSFLKEPLDLLAGDPDAVRAKSATWTNIAAALQKSAEDYDRSAAALEAQFAGAAAEAYRRAADSYARAVTGASAHARDAAKAFEVAGAIVGTVRGTIRDLIAQFCADAVIKGLAALALSWETFGGSIAAWVADTVFEATSLAARLASRITRLVQEIREFLSVGRTSARALEDGARDLRTGARSAERSVDDAAEGGTRAAGARPGEEPRDPHGSGGDPAPTRAEERQHARDDFQAATRREQQVHRNLDQAVGRQHSAESQLSAARSRLENARTPGQRAAAQRDIESAQAHIDTYRGQADHWRGELGTLQQQRAEALDHYRESLNHHSPIPESAEHPVEAGAEATKQGKESANNDAENVEKGEETTAELDDGSLVGSGGE